MNEILQTISNIGIIPVIAIEDAALAVPLAKALAEGGLPAAEVTFRTAAAEDAIRAIAREVPEMLVGAGTVLTTEQADRAMTAGATFIVAPGYDPSVTQYVIDKGGLMMPGTASAGEMQQAMNQGCEMLKFFPAEANGGVAMLKNIGAALKTAKWMCTGGVNAKNVNDYLGYEQIAAVGGTWMCKNDMIKAEKWDEITNLCKEAVKTMLGFELAHVGVNCADDKEAEQTAKTLCTLFGLDYKAGNSSIFAGKAVECMKKPGRGAHGHIAIGTNSVDRAVYHLGRQGVEFIEDSRVLDAKGKTKAIYLKQELSGFAIHLVQK